MQRKDEIALLACPFCGEGKITTKEFNNGMSVIIDEYVFASDEELSLDAKELKYLMIKAIEAWNARTPDIESQHARIERLEGAVKELISACYGAKEALGDIANISYAIEIGEQALNPQQESEDG